MEGWIIALLVIGAVVLGVLNIVETIEYRRYRKAAHAVIALAESMQVSFDEVVKYLNRTNSQVMDLTQNQMISEQDIGFIKAVIFVHSQALNLNMGKNFELNQEFIDKIRKDWDEKVRETNEQNTTTTVQG